MRRLRLPVGLLVLILAAGALAACGDDDDAGGGSAQERPNIIILLTDDQTAESFRVMSSTRQLLGDEGTTFHNAIISYPLCCPSRATILTGQYSHNTGVEENVPPHGGVLALDDSETLPVWLQEFGYATSHVGKYLNGYGEVAAPTVPDGWDAWFGLQDPSTYGYLNYKVSIDGRLEQFQGEASYQTDVLADRAVAEIDRLAAGDQPFFLNVWYTAPHGGRDLAVPSPSAPVVAPRHREEFTNAEIPGTEAFNELDVTDKPATIRAMPLIDPATADDIRNTYRAELASLLAVDESIARIVARLEETGELDNTVIVFLSDNGFMLGEHRLVFQKTVPYEESIRVPMVVRGPGFEPGSEVDGPVGNVDLAPTILELAGAQPGLAVDGQSLLPVVADPASAEDRAILIENGPAVPFVAHYEGVRTQRYTYVEYDTGEVELYDLEADPAQLTNLAGRPDRAALQAALSDLLSQLRGCAGEDCQVPVPALPG
jgi:arylsulfatase A-like enzyme